MPAKSSGKSSGNDSGQVAAKAGRPRRHRTRHPGVVLIPPRGRDWWRARYRDPDSGRLRWETLEHILTTAEQREQWARRKSEALAKRRLELDGGAPRTTGTTLEAAVGRYYEHHPHLRPATVATYKAATDKLIDWAKRVRLQSADDLTAPQLLAFRAELVGVTKRVRVKGKRGANAPSEKKRSAWSANRELAAVSTALTYCRRLGLLPRLTGDGIKDGLKKLRVDRKKIDFREPRELQKFLEAALRHDADVFKLTRAGDTDAPRYKPAAPVWVTAMLSGMRAGELLGLTWDRVKLADEGKLEVTSESKTHHARDVTLEVCPALKRLLTAMHLARGRPNDGSVFDLTKGEAKAAERRLVADYGAPKKCNLQAMRRTCGTFLTNAPSIFGAASAYRSAKQLGHSVKVAEDHYLGVVRVSPEARTIEAAMQIDKQVAAVIDSVSSAAPRDRRASSRAE